MGSGHPPLAAGLIIFSFLQYQIQWCSILILTFLLESVLRKPKGTGIGTGMGINGFGAGIPIRMEPTNFLLEAELESDFRTFLESE